jgi:hypothetical protein
MPFPPSKKTEANDMSMDMPETTESPDDTIRCPKCGAVFKEHLGNEQPAKSSATKKKGSFGSMLGEAGIAAKKDYPMK